MSDEEDYMSDKFVEKRADVRPSLIQSKREKHKLDMESRTRENIRRQRKELGRTPNEHLQESLKRAISADNKGFKLLAKMGYKPGQTLGKQLTNTDEIKETVRLKEPLSITIRDGRSGLGREAALRELSEKRKQLRQKRLFEELGAKEMSSEDFRKRALGKVEERFFQSALKKCQITCENLDSIANITQPDITWFWPERLLETDGEKEDLGESAVIEENIELDLSSAEKLEMLSSYLRTTYLFCFWCGIKYENSDDLTNCPGLTRDDH